MFGAPAGSTISDHLASTFGARQQLAHKMQMAHLRQMERQAAMTYSQARSPAKGWTQMYNSYFGTFPTEVLPTALRVEAASGRFEGINDCAEDIWQRGRQFTAEAISSKKAPNRSLTRAR